MVYDHCSIELVVADIVRKSQHSSRFMVAVAGAPGCGKSTFAEHLKQALDRYNPALASQIIAMDGFHLSNDQLRKLKLLSRKGAPQTFDVSALTALLKSVKEQRSRISAPGFNRDLDEVIPGAINIELECEIIIVEGNYLLLQQPPWQQLQPYFDLSIYLQVQSQQLEERLVRRWLEQGLDKKSALAKVHDNDLLNAQTVLEHSKRADIEIDNS